MSARAAVFSLLTQDDQLNDMGINANSVWPAQALDTAPRDKRFLILRWEEATLAFKAKGEKQILTIWAHCPREMSTEFLHLDRILHRCTQILTLATHVSGEDGTLTSVDYNGMSADFNDEGYKTITRNAAYTVVSR